MTSIEIPDYIDPAVLVPGQQVQCILDGTETVLTVVKVEPALICSKPDGTGVIVLAHTAVPVAVNAHPGPYCECDMCQSRLP